MTLNTKLRGFGVAFIGLAVFLLANHIVKGEHGTGDTWLIVTLCLLTGVIEIIRSELRDLRRSSKENKPGE